MVEPRQEFLGAITLLDGDGTGTVDSNGANLTNTGYLILNEQTGAPATGAGKGSFWVSDDSPTLPKFTDSAGTTITLGAGGGGAPTPPLDTVLGVGNETGENWIEIEDGYGLRGQAIGSSFTIETITALSGTTGSILIRTGTQGNPTASSGDIEILTRSTAGYSGDLTLKTEASGKKSGDIEISTDISGSGSEGSGSVTIGTGGAGGADAGDLTLSTGGNGSGRGGDISISTGQGGGDRAGHLTIQTGIGASGGQGGNVDILTGAAASTNQAGDITLQTGVAAGLGGRGGNITLKTGNSTGGDAGSILVQAGDGSAGDAGSITLITGYGGATIAGNLTLDLANHSFGTGVSHFGGGNFNVYCADSDNVGYRGGDATIAAGNHTSKHQSGRIDLTTSGFPSVRVGAFKTLTIYNHLDEDGDTYGYGWLPPNQVGEAAIFNRYSALVHWDDFRKLYTEITYREMV